jgi:hypothetical protein
LFATLAADAESIDPRAFLADPGKRSRLLSDLNTRLRADVLVADSGTLWDAEAAGLPLRWADGQPAPAGRLPPGAAFDPGHRSAVAALETVRRLRQVVPEDVAVGLTLTGPATLAELSGDAVDLPAAVQLALTAARAAHGAGATVVLMRETAGRAVDAATYGQVTAPLWGSLRFFQTAGALVAPAEPWRSGLGAPGPFVPCPTPAQAEASTAGGRPVGRALGPGEEVELPAGVALITHDRELRSHLPVSELETEVRRLAALASR